MSYNLSAVPKLQFFDNDGNPLVGGKLYTYEAGTTTPLATYTDSTGATPNTNPVILDSRGEANVWLAAQSYKFVLKTSTDTTIWTVDNVSNAINVSQILASGGTAGAPPYSFSADTDTGVYLAAVGQLGLTANGTPFLRGSATAMTFGQSGGANDVDVTHYGDTTQTGNLTVNGTVALAAGAVGTPSLTATGDLNTGMWFPAADTLAWSTGGGERMRVDTSGNVGIGTSSPGNFDTAWQRLVIGGGSGDVGQTIYSGSASIGTMAFADGTSGAQQYAGLIRYLHASDAMTFWANAVERMRIDSSGNVGVGVNPPQAQLHVAASSPTQGITSIFSATGLTGAQLQITQGTIEDWVIGQPAGVSAFAIWSGRNTGTNGTERLRITSAGVLQFDSGYGSVANAYGCRAWINFDGTAVTNPASMTGVRGSGNVSSVLDNGTGDYTVNFANSMPDTNYAVVGMAMGTTGTNEFMVTTPGTVAWATGSVRVGVRGGGGTLSDAAYVNLAIFR